LDGSPHNCESIGKQNFTSDALPDTKVRLTRDPGPTRKAATANDCLFDNTMTAYIAASLHYLEAILPSATRKTISLHGHYNKNEICSLTNTTNFMCHPVNLYWYYATTVL